MCLFLCFRKSEFPIKLKSISGGCEEGYAIGYYYIVLQTPYEKVGPFDTMGQADAFLSGISGRPYEIEVDFWNLSLSRAAKEDTKKNSGDVITEPHSRRLLFHSMPSSISSGGVPGSPRLSPAGDRPVPYCRARKRAYPADGAEREAAFSVLQHSYCVLLPQGCFCHTPWISIAQRE